MPISSSCLPVPRQITFKPLVLAAAIMLASNTLAQETAADDTTVVYPAAYFAEYQPVTADDMVNRIPGIKVNEEGPTRPGNVSRGGRGLGSGGGGTQILINGKRTAGKNNNSQNQLVRISASQVDYIEIIRGTGGELDVRGSNQIVNVVLTEQLATTSLSYEVNMEQYDDSRTEPGGSLSYGGQNGALNFLLSASAVPRYEHMRMREYSILGDFSPNDTVREDRIREQTTYTVSGNFDYQLSDRSSLGFNALYADDDNPTEVERLTTNLRNGANTSYREREDIPGTQTNWEVGGDFEYRRDNGHRLKALFIANQNDTLSIRERYHLPDNAAERKNLYLESGSVLEERILRGSYTLDLREGHNLEMGLERAQTTLDSSLKLATSRAGTPSPDHGGLVPVAVANADTVVEEVRYEPFAIHNWRINPRMSLETSLVYETSEISQSGEFRNSRNFDFFKPKVDYRFDITSSTQLRLYVEKVVRQLSFSDFVTATDKDDNDSNIQLGNPGLRPDYWWSYNAQVEYRLPEDMGVLNATFYRHRHYDFMQRIDVSPSEDDLRSAAGNIGMGDMWVLELMASVRLTMFDLPNVLVTARGSNRDSEVRDPFTGLDRQFAYYQKGDMELGFRHDLPQWRLNYGVNWRDRVDGDYYRWDIDDIETYTNDGTANAFVEWIGFGDITFRFDAKNFLDEANCRDRDRYLGRISGGIIEEIEYMCSTTGPVYALKMSGTF